MADFAAKQSTFAIKKAVKRLTFGLGDGQDCGGVEAAAEKNDGTANLHHLKPG